MQVVIQSVSLLFHLSLALLLLILTVAGGLSVVPTSGLVSFVNSRDSLQFLSLINKKINVRGCEMVTWVGNTKKNHNYKVSCWFQFFKVLNLCLFVKYWVIVPLSASKTCSNKTVWDKKITLPLNCFQFIDRHFAMGDFKKTVLYIEGSQAETCLTLYK